jgi:hypothetical protein
MAKQHGILKEKLHRWFGERKAKGWRQTMSTYQWVGTIDNDWRRPENWSPVAPVGGPPRGSDVLINNSSGTNTIVLNVNSRHLDSLKIEGAGSPTLSVNSHTLTVGDGGITLITGAITIAGGAISSGAAVFLASGTSISGSGTLYTAHRYFGSGTLQAVGGTLDVIGTIAKGIVLAVDTTAAAELNVEGKATSAEPVSLTSSNQTLEIAGGLKINPREIVSGGTVQLDGGLLIDPKGIALKSGALTGYGVVVTGDTAAKGLHGGGTVTASGGVLIIDAEVDHGSAAGAFDIANGPGSDLAFLRDVGTHHIHPTVTFNGDAGTLDLTALGQWSSRSDTPFHATVTGFQAGDSIVVDGESGDKVVYHAADNDLLVRSSGATEEVIKLSGTYSAGEFQLSNSGSIDTISTNAPCYCRGSLIRTDKGEVPVENLTIDDKVITMSGVARPIKWIGRRSYGGRFVMGRKDILPICIKAGALDDNMPRRDLWISPHHAMYLEGVLIEAKDLVNGVSIVQAERVKKVEYFHIELNSHDVIIAEGALSESFIDDDSRGMFHNAAEYRALYPDAPSRPARYCAPRPNHGYNVEAARQRIDARAELRTTADVPTLRGYVDMISGACISGWAQNVEHPEAPVCLEIYADGQLIGQTLANRYREDLERAGLGSGRHSFAFTPPAGLEIETVEVRRHFDGAPLKQRHGCIVRHEPVPDAAA